MADRKFCVGRKIEKSRKPNSIILLLCNGITDIFNGNNIKVGNSVINTKTVNCELKRLKVLNEIRKNWKCENLKYKSGDRVFFVFRNDYQPLWLNDINSFSRKDEFIDIKTNNSTYFIEYAKLPNDYRYKKIPQSYLEDTDSDKIICNILSEIRQRAFLKI